jgi:hypothetical protein
MEREKSKSSKLPPSSATTFSNTENEHVPLVEDVQKPLEKKSTTSNNRLSPPIEFSYTADGKTEVHNPTEREEAMLRETMDTELSPRDLVQPTKKVYSAVLVEG